MKLFYGECINDEWGHPFYKTSVDTNACENRWANAFAKSQTVKQLEWVSMRVIYNYNDVLICIERERERECFKWSSCSTITPSSCGKLWQAQKDSWCWLIRCNSMEIWLAVLCRGKTSFCSRSAQIGISSRSRLSKPSKKSIWLKAPFPLPSIMSNSSSMVPTDAHSKIFRGIRSRGTPAISSRVRKPLRSVSRLSNTSSKAGKAALISSFFFSLASSASWVDCCNACSTRTAVTKFIRAMDKNINRGRK